MTWLTIDSAKKHKPILGFCILPHSGDRYMATISWSESFGGRWDPIIGVEFGDAVEGAEWTHWCPDVGEPE